MSARDDDRSPGRAQRGAPDGDRCGDAVTLDGSKATGPLFTLGNLHGFDNAAFSLANLTVQGAGAAAGGSVAVSGAGTVTISNVHFHNWPDAVDLHGIAGGPNPVVPATLALAASSFDNGRLGRVNGLPVRISTISGSDPGHEAPFMTLSGETIAITGATITGSAHSLLTSRTATIGSSTFTGKVSASGAGNDPAFGQGGALALACLGTPCSAAIGQSHFTGNSAATGGGAIVAIGPGANVSVAGSDFTGNTVAAGVGGGAIHAGGASIALLHSTVSGNTAPEGGAVLLDPSSGLDARAVTFARNVAQGGGGAVSAHGGITLNQAVFRQQGRPARRRNRGRRRDAAGQSAGYGKRGGGIRRRVRRPAERHGCGEHRRRVAIGAVPAGGKALANMIMFGNAPNCTPDTGPGHGSASLQFGDASCAGLPVADPELDR